MTLTSILLAVAMASAHAQEGAFQSEKAGRESLAVSVEADFVAADQVPDSKTKPVSSPLTKDKDVLNLKQIPFKIVHETYRETNGKRNWEIFIRNADGSDPVNLTNTAGHR